LRVRRSVVALVLIAATTVGVGTALTLDEDDAPPSSRGAGARGDGPAAGERPWRARPGVLLARPASPEEDNTTLRKLLDLVRQTPAGERIRILAHSFSFVPAAEALVEAHERGVGVQVVVDRSVSRGWVAPGLLRDGLGTDRRARSFLRLVPGDLHQKTWSFTRTGSTRDVVLVGSMNLTYQSAGQYNDVVTYVGDRAVRRIFDRRFLQLVRELPDVAATGSVDLGPDRAWFFPGYDRVTDPVLEQLAAVPPAGAGIRVVMYAWLDERGLDLARLLVAKDDAGADVEVVLGVSTGPAIRELLEDSGVEVHTGVLRDGDVHHKLTLVRHPGPDGPVRFVLTGSDNYTTRSLDRPELLLRLDGSVGQRFARYERWVDRLVARS
jgi:microcompartment protein CcmK/EutM